MPNKTIALTAEESATLDAFATEQGTTADALLLAEAKAQIAAVKAKQLGEWWRDLPDADKRRIYDAENA